MSSYSSFIDYINSLALIQKHLYQIGGPILIVLGNVSCIVNLIVFTKKNLRKSPCSVYFIAYNISNFITINFLILTMTLSAGYRIFDIAFNLSFCRLYMYMTFIMDVLSPSYLVLASIDRILITSPNALTRQRSTHRFACICITTVTLFWLIFHIHAFVRINMLQVDADFSGCYSNWGTYSSFTRLYTVIVKGIVAPFLLAVSGSWTVCNLKSLGRVRDATLITTGDQRTQNESLLANTRNRQLIRILLIEIVTYLIFCLALTVILVYQLITQNTEQNLESVLTNVFLLGIGIFSNYIPYCIACFNNLLASKTFRKEVKNTILCK